MAPSTETPMLELDTQLWKARAQAKQKWLDRELAQPLKDSDDAMRRTAWVKRALAAVKRGQAEVKYRAALIDAYAEHLTALEMALLSAAERRGTGQMK